MAATDILSLKNTMGERAIRWLYALALILIALVTIFGIVRGVMIASHPPMTNPPAVTANANPPANTMTPAQPAQPNAQAMRPMGPRGFYGRGFGHRFFMMRHHPMRAGIFMIVGALLRGFIALMIVRILAEMGIAILGMPKRA